MSASAALRRNVRRAGRAARERGTLTVLRDCAAWGAGFVIGRRLPPARFAFRGRDYLAFHHPYHYTWLNERAVEVPIFRALVAEAPGGSVLEVGNVLSHYGSCEHDVADKYERGPNVINVDAADLDPGRRYGLIVSISTLEHLGLDERPRDPGKPLRALEHLRSLLDPGGRLVFSVPAGYNAELDRGLREGAVALANCAALRREGRHWHEVPCETAWTVAYDRLLYRAGAVVIATAAAA